MAQTHLDFASLPQIRRTADSLYYRQHAFSKLSPHEMHKIADIKDTLSNSEPVLERQGLQQFPERIVRRFKPGERSVFWSFLGFDCLKTNYVQAQHTSPVTGSFLLGHKAVAHP